MAYISVERYKSHTNKVNSEEKALNASLIHQEYLAPPSALV
jgi:hypothetical protein